MTENPDKPSADWQAMSEYWDQVETILEGTKAMRAAGETYLPKFPNESKTDYDFRRKTAKFTNVFRDITEGLASKPFAQELTLAEGTSAAIEDMQEDIDGRGNSLHVFAADTFFCGIAKAIDWILVDYTKADADEQRTVEEEKTLGLRPYWVHVPASAVINIESEFIGGREQLSNIRILEAKNRVRELVRVGDVVTYIIHLMDEKGLWQIEDEGRLSIGVIPMVPFVAGRRKGSKWQFHPPMRDAADLQVELYQQETGLKNIKDMTCFPMLAGNGVTPEMENGVPKRVPVGPKAVLYAPPSGDDKHGEWKWIIPEAPTLSFLAADIAETTKQLRELGRQPLTAQSGNLTKITTAVAAGKGNSAVQMWALGLKDALEMALSYTAMWLKITEEPEVKIFTDFGLDAMAEMAPGLLLKARENGDISGPTLRVEFRRYGLLGPEFNEDDEVKQMKNDILTEDDQE